MSLVEKADFTLKCILNGKLSGDIDDTLLQKLLSKLEDNSTSSDSFQSVIKQTKVLDYICKSCSQDESPSPVHSFALQMLSVMIKESIIDIFSEEHEAVRNTLLRRLQMTTPLASRVSSSVRVSCLLCLSAVVEKEPGYAWILENGLLDFGWRNLSEPSIFVQRSSEVFLSLAFRKSLELGDAQMTTRISEALSAYNGNGQTDGQKTFTGCINFLAMMFGPLPSLLVSKVSKSLGTQFLETFTSYTLENETADKLNKMAAAFLDDSSYLMISKQLWSSGRLACYIKFSANLLLLNKAGAETHLNVLVIPLCLLAGQTPSSSDLPSEFLSCLEASLKDKVKCRRILSATLTSLTKVLAHINQKLILEVLKLSSALIKICSTNDCQDGKRVLLAGCPKSLVALLVFQKELLTSGLSLDSDTAEIILSSQVNILQDSALPSSVFQSSCQIVSLLFPHLSWDETAEPTKLSSRDALGCCLSRRLLDRHWEVVDSVMELCNTLFSDRNVSQGFHTWFLKHELHVLLWDMLTNDNSEGYVRAACLRAVVAMACRRTCWLRLEEEKHLTKANMTRTLFNLLTTDPEAFVQREAMNGIQRLLDSDFLNSEDPVVTQSLSCAVTSCLDWEVKVTAVHCCQKLLQSSSLFTGKNEVRSVDQLTRMFEDLFANGCLSSLASALRDCDRPVKYKAAETVIALKEKVNETKCTEFLNLLAGLQSVSPEVSDNGMTCDTVTKSEEEKMYKRDEVLNMVVDTDMYDRITAVIGPTMDKNVEPLKTQSFNQNCWQEAAAFLWQCDPCRIMKESSLSTDVYEDNLSSLLDDILAVVDGKSDEEYQAIDCY